MAEDILAGNLTYSDEVEDVQPEDIELNEAMAEWNALNVRFNAMKDQQLSWAAKFAVERKKLMESFRLAVYRYDKEKLNRKKQSATPISLPSLTQAPKSERNESADSLAVTEDRASIQTTSVGPAPFSIQIGINSDSDSARSGHPPRKKLTRVRSEAGSDDHSPNFGISHHTAVGRSISAMPSKSVSSFPEKKNNNSLRSSSNEILEDLVETEDDPELVALITNRLASQTSAAPPSTAIAENHLSTINAADSSSRTFTSPDISRQTFETPSVLSHRAVNTKSVIITKRPTPVLAVRPQRRLKSEGSRRPISGSVHRANALDLDEMRRVTERIYQRLNPAKNS